MKHWNFNKVIGAILLIIGIILIIVVQSHRFIVNPQLTEVQSLIFYFPLWAGAIVSCSLGGITILFDERSG